jgi:bifunctional DNA-binding transcriptional regulator/antitoxin component of YhaV-PrlF toxin-antitoxin module
MSDYVLEVQEDNDGEAFIVLPDELIEHLGWQEGDILDWDVRGEKIFLSKVNDPSGYQVIEE